MSSLFQKKRKHERQFYEFKSQRRVIVKWFLKIKYEKSKQTNEMNERNKSNDRMVDIKMHP